MPPDIDTSTYPKYEQKGFLDKAQQFQAVESNAIGINAQKLKLVNEQFGLINNELGKLANEPNISKEQAAQRLDTFTKTFNLPPQVRQHMLGELQSSPDVKSFAENAIRRGMSTMEAVNFQYGTPGMVNTGAAQVPVATSPKTGVRQTGAPIQQQLGPAQLNTPIDVQDESGVTTKQPLQKFIQDTGGTTQAPGQIAPAATQAGPRPSWAAPPAAAAPQKRTGIEGPNPMLAPGTKMRAEDQELATQKMTDVKPAIEALRVLKGIQTGPGRPALNELAAFLKGNNIIATDKVDDPTVLFQEGNKYLAQYVQKNGSRSDADLASREISNPNVGTQINPALMNLTKKVIAFDRAQAIREKAFGGADNSKYGEHRSSFPQSIDTRALNLDLLDPDERNKVFSEVEKSLDSKDKQERIKAERFVKTYKLAKKFIYEVGAGQ